MIAYNKESLQNLYAHEQFSDALTNNCISADTYKELTEKTPAKFYTPNIFIRIGLALLTIIIILFTTTLIALLGGVDFDAFSGYFITMGLLCYVLLEVMVGNNKHYNSGVDNILSFAVFAFLLSGMEVLMDKSGVTGDIISSGLTCILCGFMAIRFADAFMAAIATGFLVMLSLYIFSIFLPVYLIYIPAIAVCYIIYSLANRAAKQYTSHIFHFIYKAISVTALVLLYLCTNFYIVDECSGMFFGEQALIPKALRFVYWAFTLLLPVVYIIWGIYKKDIAVIRTGVLLCAVAAITFRTYFSLISIEAALILSGSLLAILTYVLITYLKTPKHGFTFQPEAKAKGELDIEDLITEKIINRAGM